MQTYTAAVDQLGDVIRRRSRALGLTQATLAERTGVHVRQIRRYENGEQQPVLAVAARLAATLEMTLDELAGVASSHVVVDGDWWAARQVRIDGHDITVALPVRLTRHGTTIELEGLQPGRGGTWRGELRLWSGPTLTGWYAGAAGDVRSRGAMLLLLGEGGTVAEGRWVGVASDRAVVTGAAALARTREEAREVIAADRLGAKPS
jgi:transcriptional regulator with XRE-family HTH domain